MSPSATSIAGEGRSEKPSLVVAAVDDGPPSKRRKGNRADAGQSAKRLRAQATEVVDFAAKRSQVGDQRADSHAAKGTGKKRPRKAAPELLRDCILGYIDDDSGDPPRSGTTKYRQSKEITEMLKVDTNIPIAKERRSEFVWVAAVRLPDGRKKYTWDAEVMTPLPKFEHEEDNTCDICGACCVEVLYEFRCYNRVAQDTKTVPTLGVNRERRLHPGVAYISKECGRGLLGVQSEASKLRERLYRVISADPEQAVETLKELWRVSNKAQQKVITDELRHFAGIEIGESDRVAEFRNAEAAHGSLHKSADDVFRAAARMLGAALSSRELASVAVQVALDSGASPRGYFASVVSALKDRQPLPIAISPWSKDDVRETLAHFVRAWPVHVELLDSLSKPESFNPQHGNEAEQLTLRMVYLHGCGELHALSSSVVDKSEAQSLRTRIGDLLGQSKTAFKLADGHLSAVRVHRKKEDEALMLPEGEISAECIRATLDGISWPDCTTRGNVVPEGASVISAFPLGVVNNYALGLMCSRHTLLRPKLTRLLTRFLAQTDSEFSYTTIQLNRNYAARMHVDGNNDGPSYIIAVGEFTGGELWVYDEKNGDYEVELKETMKGWAHLKVGSKLRGRLVDIKNKWFAFNGTVPHMALPFQGCRMSIVYFSRKKWQTTKTEVIQQLEDLEFRMPRDHLAEIPSTATQGIAAQPVEEGKEETAADEEEEVDEVSSDGSSSDEDRSQEPGQASHDWATRFRARLGCMSGQGKHSAAAAARQAVLVACHAGLGLPVLALRELLPERDHRALCVCEGEDGATRFVKANCKPEYVFQELGDVIKAEGHCEVHHRNVKLPPLGASDFTLFSGGFHISTFAGLDTPAARLALVHGSCSDPYHLMHRYIAAQRPCIAILEIRGLSEIPQAQRPGALKCLVDGIDGSSGGAALGSSAAWGFRQLGGYGFELLELRAKDFGLPLAGVYAFAVLVREDCGGQAAAELAVGLARALRGLLPRTSVGELLLDNSSARLLQVVKTEWKRTDRAVESSDAKASAKRPFDAKAISLHAFAKEAKDLGIKPGQAPYTELLHSRIGVRDKEWFPHASAVQKTFLNLAYAQAMRAGAELDSLVVDMNQSIRSQPWRDDGLLPAALAGSGEGGALHYSFSKHRPLMGVEVLGCHGMPAAKLDARGVGDAQLARLASLVVPMPVFGAVLCAALAAADFEQHPGLPMPCGKAAELVAQAPVVPEELSVATVKAQIVDETSEDLQFGGRAAAFLNLVRHGTFAQSTEGQAPSAAEPSGEAVKMIHSALAKVAESDKDGDAASEQALAGGTSRSAAPAPDEAKEWPARLSSLRAGKLGFQANAPSCGAAMRWIREAAEDPAAELSSDIIEVGTAYLCGTLAKARKVPVAVVQQRLELLNALRDVDRVAEAARVSEALTTLRFLQELDEGSKRLAISYQTEKGMSKYITGILGKVAAWPMRKGFLEHFAQAVKGGWAPHAFNQSGGLELLAGWLHGCPEKLEKDWPRAADTLGIVASVAAGAAAETAAIVLPQIHATVRRFSNLRAASQLPTKLETAMVQVVVEKMKNITSKNAVPKILQDFAQPPGEPWQRFRVTLELLQSVHATLERAKDCSAQTVAEWQRAKTDFCAGTNSILVRAGTLKDGPWKALSQLEDRMVLSVEAKLDDLAGKAEERETAEKARRDKARRAEEAKREQAKRTHFEKEVAALKALVQDGRLRDATHGGLEALLAAMQEVRMLVKEGLQSTEADAALKAGEVAGRHFCEQPERRSRQSRWLRQQGLGCCRELLEAQGLLDCLGTLAEECRGSAKLPERWQAVRLPKRICSVLLAAVASGKLRKTKFDILDNEVPHGWSREFSQSAGLHYFKRMYGKGTQWEWPTEDEPVDDIDEPPVPDCRAGLPRPGAACYVGDTECPVRCALCDVTGEVQHWERLSDAVQALRLDYMLELGWGSSLVHEDTGHEVVKGLKLAWFAELAWCLSAAKAPALVHQYFWHGVVRPHIPNQSTPIAILKALGEILRKARSRERELFDTPPAAASAPEAQDPAACRAVELGRRALAGLDADGQLGAAAGPAACTRLVASVRELQAAVEACGPPQCWPPTAAAALAATRWAARRHHEGPARRCRARAWLRHHGLGHCAPLLEGAAVLERLPDLAAQPGLAGGLGIPERCLEALTVAIKSGQLIEEDLRPGPLPDGWELKVSSSTGLQYFISRDGKQQWEWPEPPEPAEEALVEPSALNGLLRGQRFC